MNLDGSGGAHLFAHFLPRTFVCARIRNLKVFRRLRDVVIFGFDELAVFGDPSVAGHLLRHVEHLSLLLQDTNSASSIWPGQSTTFSFPDRRRDKDGTLGGADSDASFVGELFPFGFKDFRDVGWCDFISGAAVFDLACFEVEVQRLQLGDGFHHLLAGAKGKLGDVVGVGCALFFAFRHLAGVDPVFDSLRPSSVAAVVWNHVCSGVVLDGARLHSGGSAHVGVDLGQGVARLDLFPVVDRPIEAGFIHLRAPAFLLALAPGAGCSDLGTVGVCAVNTDGSVFRPPCDRVAVAADRYGDRAVGCADVGGDLDRVFGLAGRVLEGLVVAADLAQEANNLWDGALLLGSQHLVPQGLLDGALFGGFPLRHADLRIDASLAFALWACLLLGDDLPGDLGVLAVAQGVVGAFLGLVADESAHFEAANLGEGSGVFRQGRRVGEPQALAQAVQSGVVFHEAAAEFFEFGLCSHVLDAGCIVGVDLLGEGFDLLDDGRLLLDDLAVEVGVEARQWAAVAECASGLREAWHGGAGLALQFGLHCFQPLAFGGSDFRCLAAGSVVQRCQQVVDGWQTAFHRVLQDFAEFGLLAVVWRECPQHFRKCSGCRHSDVEVRSACPDLPVCSFEDHVPLRVGLRFGHARGWHSPFSVIEASSMGFCR